MQNSIDKLQTDFLNTLAYYQYLCQPCEIETEQPISNEFLLLTRRWEKESLDTYFPDRTKDRLSTLVTFSCA